MTLYLLLSLRTIKYIAKVVDLSWGIWFRDLKTMYMVLQWPPQSFWVLPTLQNYSIPDLWVMRRRLQSFWVLPTLQKTPFQTCESWEGGYNHFESYPRSKITYSRPVSRANWASEWVETRAGSYRVRVCNFNRSDCAFFILLLNEVNSNLIQAWLILAHFE